MKFLVKLAAAGGVALLLGSLGAWYARGLPDVSELRRQFAERRAAEGRSAWVSLSAISHKLQAAVLVSEDVAFYRHRGFNFLEMRESLLEDVRTGRYRRGGSTITQQVAKNLFLGREKTVERKLREAILTWRLERALPKDEILETYLNVAEWGDGIRGAGAAARFYFGKPAADLTWPEAALLAAILPNARRFSPLQAPEQAMRRRQVVLLKLRNHRDMSPAEFQEAMAAPCFGTGS